MCDNWTSHGLALSALSQAITAPTQLYYARKYVLLEHFPQRVPVLLNAPHISVFKLLVWSGKVSSCTFNVKISLSHMLTILDNPTSDTPLMAKQ